MVPALGDGGCGLVIALLLAKVPVERISRWTWPIYGAMVASLIAVRLIG